MFGGGPVYKNEIVLDIKKQLIIPAAMTGTRIEELCSSETHMLVCPIHRSRSLMQT